MLHSNQLFGITNAVGATWSLPSPPNVSMDSGQGMLQQQISAERQHQNYMCDNEVERP